MCSMTQIMKSDEDVRMISAEAPVLFAKVISKLQQTTIPMHPFPCFYGDFHELKCAGMTKLLHANRLVRCSS